MTTEYEMCEHGRHIGAVCIPCAEKEFEKTIQDRAAYGVSVADYYDSQEKEYINAPAGSFPPYPEPPYPEYVDPYDMKPEHVEKQQESGLDAPYYDIPEHVRCAQDMIEWLNLDFSQGNILKSIIRENNPNVQKKTTAIYEAEKQYYYSSRRLRSLQEKEADSS